MKELLIPDGYIKWLADLKLRIGESQLRAVLSVNSELVRLYWDIGCEIQQRQTSQGWGSKIIDRLADDLRHAFPEMKGFSPTNLKYMRRFSEECPGCLIGQQPADQLPWFHIVVILTKLTAQQEREFILPFHPVIYILQQIFPEFFWFKYYDAGLGIQDLRILQVSDYLVKLASSDEKKN